MRIFHNAIFGMHFSNSSYVEVVRHVVRTDGIIGLFGRGLKTRIMANALNVSIIICICFALEILRMSITATFVLV